MACQVWIGGGLLLVSLGCSALSLGPVQGQALIGRSLDVSIPVNLSEGETTSDICANAQVFFADAPISSGGVKTGVVFSASTKAASVRVQTFAPLAETFARIDLQVGCSQRITRSFVLLADLAPVSPVISDGVQHRASAGNGSSDPVASSRVPVSAAPAPSPAKVSSGSVARLPVKAVPSAERAVAVIAPPALPVAEPKNVSHLKLDPVELMAAANQMQPTLRMSVDAPAESEEDAGLPQRRQLARVLWKAMNDSPEQLAANLLKAEVGEVEVARANTALAAAKQAEQAAQVQLAQELENRYTNPVFAGLVAALIAALAGLYWLWRGSKQDAAPQIEPWWKQNSVFGRADPASSGPATPKKGWLPKLKVHPTPTPPHSPSAEPSNDDMGNGREREMPALATGKPADPKRSATHPSAQQKTVKASARAVPDFTNTFMPESATSVATEELFGLQQQVEFFISVGQSNQAIKLLRNHLEESEEANPLAYLELLRLYHELARRDEYMALQREFNQKFNGNAPDFERFDNWRNGLDRYEAALSRVAREVLDVHPNEALSFENSYFGSEPDSFEQNPLPPLPTLPPTQSEPPSVIAKPKSAEQPVTTPPSTGANASNQATADRGPELDLNLDMMDLDFNALDTEKATPKPLSAEAKPADMMEAFPPVFDETATYVIKKSGKPM